MRRYLISEIFVCLVLLVLIGLSGHAMAGEIEAGLKDILSATPDDQPVSVLIFLKDRIDLNGMSAALDAPDMTRGRRHETVVTSLMDKAAATQRDLTAYLSQLKLSGSLDDYHSFWIVNAIEADLTKQHIDAVAARSDVVRVYYNYEIEAIDPVDMTTSGPSVGAAVENGIAAVRAPEVWAMGYTGAGILVANIDTGVEGGHPALASRWAGVADARYVGHPEWAWHDPYLGINDFPYDNGGHGTHTMGTICGGAPGDEIGVAPGAHWIASASIDRGGGIERTVSDAILSFQWMTDPDGNPSTSWDVPHVCSNSWGVTTSHGYPPCDELFWSYIDACEAAGTVVIFAAGNEGSGGLRRPGDRATDEYRNLAVAAVDGNTSGWPIAYFSSIGPTYCTPTGEAAIKPDIAAPGVSVRSAYPGQTYVYMSGTSMATPHVAGVIALIRQANPNLSVDEVKQIIYSTAYDLGAAGEDNYYGYGMIDAYEAVMMALGTAGPTADFSGTPTSGCTPLTVNFTDLSSGEITSWSWNFGDGGTSSAQNPSHTYVTAGDYTVSLTVTDASGSDTEVKTGYIHVYDAPVADFVGAPTSGGAPLIVNFTDLSTGNPSAWSWNFGDGGTSSVQNPAHVYPNPGLYTVTLTATNMCGSDVETKTDYIYVTTQPKMHVADLVVTRVYVAPKWAGMAQVTVLDQGGQPVSNATVSGFFNAPDTKTKTGVTNGSGVAIIESKTTPKPPGDWCFEVTDVTHATYPYDPASNVVTRACETGFVFHARAIADRALPDQLMLEQNRPNPFNPVTTITFGLPQAGHVTLIVYNITGQRIVTLADNRFEAGYHAVDWDASSVASGIYLYRLTIDQYSLTKKMVLLK